jgi:hypothetical protein
VPKEGVVNALHRIHDALAPGAFVVDTQPVSTHPPVESGGRQLGELDMREWGATIEAIDALTDSVIDDGLFTVEHERELTVTDTYENGAEFLQIVGGWQGTRIPTALAERLSPLTSAVGVHQAVRLRVLASR